MDHGQFAWHPQVGFHKLFVIAWRVHKLQHNDKASTYLLYCGLRAADAVQIALTGSSQLVFRCGQWVKLIIGLGSCSDQKTQK